MASKKLSRKQTIEQARRQIECYERAVWRAEEQVFSHPSPWPDLPRWWDSEMVEKVMQMDNRPPERRRPCEAGSSTTATHCTSTAASTGYSGDAGLAPSQPGGVEPAPTVPFTNQATSVLSETN